MLKRIDKQSFEYPSLLRMIDLPPEVLYIKGDLPDPNAPMVAVVGSRKCTDYGRRAARQITEALGHAGLVIVSGLAYGIDAIAHEAAIDVGAQTVAVIASGIDIITPTGHRGLADRILDHDGAIITEFPPGTPAYKDNFPVRNRIISGMCIATIVIEATSRSGSLITANLARDQGRDLFALPGQIFDEASKGTNSLIKSGAHVITSASDIMDLLTLKGLKLNPQKEKEMMTADTKEEAAIIPLLGRAPKHIDKIIEECGLQASVVLASVTMMEIKGKVRHVGGGHYIIG